MSYSSSVTIVLEKCPEFTHFNLIATWKPSWVVLSTNYLRRCHNFASFRSCDFYWDKRRQNNKRVYKDFFCKRCKRLSHLWSVHHTPALTWYLWTAGVVVRTINLRLSDRVFNFQSGRYRVVTAWIGKPSRYITINNVISAFHPCRVRK